MRSVVKFIGPAVAMLLLASHVFAAVMPIETYWGQGPWNFPVSFEQPTPVVVRQEILKVMNEWSETVALDAAGKPMKNAKDQFVMVRYSGVHFFDCTPQRGMCRIRLNSGEGNYSYVGRMNLSIGVGPTMWFDGLNSKADVQGWGRWGILHEVGHWLNFEHEASRKELLDKINKQRAYSFAQVNWGWAPPLTDEYFLKPHNYAKMFKPSPVDVNSVMCYAIPASITNDGRAFGGTGEYDPITQRWGLSYWDRRYVGNVYPLPKPKAK